MTSLARFKINGLRAVAASSGLFWAICICFLASKTIIAQDSVQRDHDALTILTQTIRAGGEQELLASVRDFTETGTVTYYLADQVTGDVTVKGRGLHQLKIEAELSDGKRTTVVDGEGGSLKEENGWTRPIYRQSANDLGSLTLPYLPLIAAIRDSSISIVYGGLVTRNGAPMYDVRLRRVYEEQQDPSGKRGERDARDFYIDPKTFLVAAVSDRIQIGSARGEGAPREILHEILYSNYQPESGIMAPLTIVETIQGVTGFTMNFSQVTFNSGLGDSDFAW